MRTSRSSLATARSGFAASAPPPSRARLSITLGGAVAYPGVYEVEHGSPLTTLIDAAGGATEDVRAVLVGGYAGAWVDGGYLGALTLADEELATYGARVGTGVLIVLGREACGLAETARVTRWLAAESAGQCGPCVNGLAAVASTLEAALTGAQDVEAHARLSHLMAIVRGRGACSHPDGTVRLVGSAIEVFAEELADHVRYGRCGACTRPATLPIPAGRAPRMAVDDRPHVSARPRSRARGRSSALRPSGGSR